MNINFNHPQFKYINTTTSNDSSSIDEIPIGKEIVLPERVSFNEEEEYYCAMDNNLFYKQQLDSETFGYDIIEGVLVVGYSYEVKRHPSRFCFNGEIAFEGEDKDDIDLEEEEGQIINKTFYSYDINEYSGEDKYIIDKWDKMVMYREELKVKLNEVTQCIPAYDGIIPPENLNGIVEGFRLLDID